MQYVYMYNMRPLWKLGLMQFSVGSLGFVITLVEPHKISTV